jgi:hypothetical protein
MFIAPVSCAATERFIVDHAIPGFLVLPKALDSKKQVRSNQLSESQTLHKFDHSRDDQFLWSRSYHQALRIL